MKEKIEYCPKCGANLIPTMIMNEIPFYKRSFFSIYPYEVIGDAFKTTTGEKLYRVECNCPVRVKESFWKKPKFHYGKYVAEDLTRKEVRERFDI